MSQFKFELGARVKDSLTGLEGPILYRVQYLTGCNQYGIYTGIDKETNKPKKQQVDENRLVLTGEVPFTLPGEEKPVTATKPGGPNTIMGSPTH